MNHEPKQAGNYEILQEIRLGGRVMLLGYDAASKDTPYMTCYQQYNLIGERIFPDTVSGKDYFEIFSVFLERIQEQQQVVAQFRSHRPVPLETLGPQHCRPGKETESLEKQLIILSPSSLAPEYRTADCQLGYAIDGFGCAPKSRGQAVFVEELYSGEVSRWDRSDILGLADLNKLPDWAKGKIQAREQARNQPKKNKGGQER